MNFPQSVQKTPKYRAAMPKSIEGIPMSTVRRPLAETFAEALAPLTRLERQQFAQIAERIWHERGILPRRPIATPQASLAIPGCPSCHPASDTFPRWSATLRFLAKLFRSFGAGKRPVA